MNLRLQRLPHAHDLPLPKYATAESAGLDLVAACDQDLSLLPGERAAIACGISIALPKGFEAQLRPRSGLALKHGITVLNTPGTIDSDYRGEIKAILVNLGKEAFRVERGMKIAQLVIARHEHVTLTEVGSLPETERGEGGFGSTGIKAG